MMTKKTVTQSPRILQVRKDRQYDCVYLHGKKIILGRTGTPEADNAYRKLQVQVLTDPTLLSFKPQQVTVDNLCLAYLQYAKEHNPGHVRTYAKLVWSYSLCFLCDLCALCG